MSATVEKPDKDERRKEILDAAFLEFSKKGYAGASMEAIARRARASKETLYAWFDNKETLLNTLIASRLDGMASRVVAAAEIPPTSAPPDPSGTRIRIVKQPVACSPCGRRVCPIDFRCMGDLSVEEVFRATLELVKRWNLALRQSSG